MFNCCPVIKDPNIAVGQWVDLWILMIWYFEAFNFIPHLSAHICHLGLFGNWFGLVLIWLLCNHLPMDILWIKLVLVIYVSKRINNSPSTVHCGTPESTWAHGEYFPPITTRWLLCLEIIPIHLSVLPFSP